jgi:hypothetical protein
MVEGDVMAVTTYQIGSYTFTPQAFFPRELFDRLTDVRVTRPQVVEEEARARTRRPRLTTDGRLVILAADHPARGVAGVGGDPIAMGNRWGLLSRILRVVTTPEVDGVMATPDIIEELFIISRLVRESGGPPLLDGKVLLGCMNRGGLAGAAFEMDDRMTAFTPDLIGQLSLDGANLMFRLEPSEPSSGWTIEYCARAIDRLCDLGIIKRNARCDTGDRDLAFCCYGASAGAPGRRGRSRTSAAGRLLPPDLVHYGRNRKVGEHRG